MFLKEGINVVMRRPAIHSLLVRSPFTLIGRTNTVVDFDGIATSTTVWAAPDFGIQKEARQKDGVVSERG